MYLVKLVQELFKTSVLFIFLFLHVVVRPTRLTPRTLRMYLLNFHLHSEISHVGTLFKCEETCYL